MTDGGIDASQVDDLDSAADQLYGLDTDTFVAARDQLVKALRAGGRRDLAGEVKALRRPTVIAAELNRVLRTSPADREALIAAAQALAEGQHRLLAGDVVDLAGLQAAHRAAVATLADRAERHQGEVHAALEAASVDESLHPQLHRATFAQEPTPTRGFDLLAAAGMAALPGQRPERPSRPARPTPGTRRLPGSRRPADPEPSRPAPGDRPGTHAEPAEPDTAGAETEPASTSTGSAKPTATGTGAAAEPAGTSGDARPTASRTRRAGGQAAETGAERAADPPTEAGPEPERRPVGPRKLQTVPTAQDLELAGRRLAAARASEEKAGERVGEAEARLADARRHHDETIRRREAAEAALARLADR